MRAIDTNIVVRYLTGDHPEQSGRAKQVVNEGPVFASTTVLLESEWVLRSVYGFSRREVAGALRRFAGLPHVAVEDPVSLATALDRAENGMDFADALHLGAAAPRECVLTFDRWFIETARGAPVSVREP